LSRFVVGERGGLAINVREKGKNGEKENGRPKRELL
jgi:hypothetical protein